jgi:hypothetical protein
MGTRRVDRRGAALLQRAYATKADWTRNELDRLYTAYGFEIRHGGKHDIVVHPDHPDLRATLTRSNPLAKGYIGAAVSLIAKLQQRENQGD